MGHHGERSLESFCQWQYQEFGGPRYLGTNHIPGGREDIPPVDTAVLVTRYGGINRKVCLFSALTLTAAVFKRNIAAEFIFKNERDVPGSSKLNYFSQVTIFRLYRIVLLLTLLLSFPPQS